MKYISFLFITASANLICNGDFEIYSLNFVTPNIQSAMIASDSACWYDQANQDIQIKRLSNPETTQAAQLSTNTPYTLCQNPSLIPHVYYRLQFTLYAPEKAFSMLLRVSLNNKLLTTLELQNQNQFGSQSVDFTTEEWFNWLCFHEIHESFNNYGIGGFLDNVTLFQIPTPIPTNQTSLTTRLFNINLLMETKQLSSELYLISDAEFQGWMIINLAKNTEILFQRYEQEYIITFNQQGNLVFIVKVQNSNISDIEVRTYEFIQEDFLFQVKFNVDQKEVYFSLLDQRQKNIIENAHITAQTIAEVINQVCSIVSASLSSYLILSLLNLWNLTLMYSFLAIETVPHFCRDIYEMMMNLSYNKGSIVNWLIIAFGLQESDFEADFQNKLTEYMSVVKEYTNLNKFGFSSKVLLNNVESFLIVGLLLVKIFIAKVILRCIPQTWKEVLNIKFNYKIIFISEVIAASPFFLLSACVSLKQSVYIWEQGAQKIFQLILLLISLLILPLWFIYKYEELNKISKDIKKAEHKYKQIRYCLETKAQQKIEKQVLNQKIKIWKNKISKEKISVKYSLYEFYLNISIPLLIVLRSISLFMIVNSVILAARTRYLIKNASRLDFLDRVFAIGITIVWIIHHLSFFLLFWLGQPDMFPKLNSYLGIAIIITVIGGACFEFLRIICDLIFFIIEIIKNLKSRYCKNKICTQELRKIKQKQEKKPKKSFIIQQKSNIFDRNCHNSPKKDDKQCNIQKYQFKVQNLSPGIVKLKKIYISKKLR